MIRILVTICEEIRVKDIDVLLPEGTDLITAQQKLN